MAYKKWGRFDLFDFYVMLIGLYFGLWGIAGSILTGAKGYNILSTFLAFMIALIPVFITWYLLNYVSINANYRNTISYLSFEKISKKLLEVNGYFLSIFVLLLLAFMIYSMNTYNIAVAYSITSLEAYHIHLPVWYKVIFSLYRSLLMTATIVLTIRLYNSRGFRFWGWFTLSIIIFTLTALFGRASYVTFWLIFFITYVIKHKPKIFSATPIIFLVLIFMSTVLFSNFYQRIRAPLVLLPPKPELHSDIPRTLSDHYFRDKLWPQLSKRALTPHQASEIVSDSSGTVSNFKKRPASWGFNYLFIDQQIHHGYYKSLSYGAILKAAVIFTIPREIWKNKPANQLQPLAFKLNGLNYTYVRAPSLFGFLQADFGFLSIPLAIFFLFFAALIAAYILKWCYNRPILFLFVVGQTTFYFSLVELNYDAYFYYFRNTFLLIGAYWLPILTINSLKKLFRSGHNLRYD